MVDIEAFWQAVLRQDPKVLHTFFCDNAYVNWHCTNEHFTVEEFIRANCEYPSQWDGVLERIEIIDNLIITVARIHSKKQDLSFHAVSFIQTQEDKICGIDEYWGDDGPAPQWRLDKHIGIPIHP